MANKVTRIPAHFFEIEPRQVARYIFVQVFFWLGPTGISYFLFSKFHLAPFLVTFLCLPLLILSGIGLHNLGLVGHEGLHFNLHKNRFKSSALGILFSSFIPFHFDVGFGIQHSKHHRATNTERDPDALIFSKYANIFSRIFLARSHAARSYFKCTFALACGKLPGGESIPMTLTLSQLKILARLNICLSVLWLLIYGVAFYFSVSLAMALIGFPYLVAFVGSSLRPFLEHAGSTAISGAQSRVWTTPMVDFFQAGINFHITHHLYPAIPAYKIKSAHLWLKENGGYSSDALEEANTFGKIFDVLFLKYPKISGSRIVGEVGRAGLK
jgi:beta-carotene hydroxylase